MTSTKFALYFPEANGSLFVKELRRGAQGIAVLVRSVTDNQLYVRKQSHWNVEEEKNTHALRPDSDRVIMLRHSFSTVWQFCNGGTLEDFCNAYNYQDEYVPEILVWRFFSQLLGMMKFLHCSCIPGLAHRDIHEMNVFVHWPAGSRLPEFYLGDFGYAVALDSAEDFGSQKEGLVAGDLTSLGCCLKRMMLLSTDPDEPIDFDIEFFAPVAEQYSSQLLDCISDLIDLRHSARDSLVNYDLSDLQQRVDNTYLTMSQDSQHDYSQHAPAVSDAPMLFDSKDDVLHLGRQTLYPSSVVKVNPSTFEVVDTE